MRISAETFWSPKLGNCNTEYEDAFSPDGRFVGQRKSSFRFAIADGATETSFSQAWATQLVRAFCSTKLDEDFRAPALRHLRARWKSIVSRRPLPWYAEEKVRAGAFSALLGLELGQYSESDQTGVWHALAVGDSCVFHVRGPTLLTCFPISAASEFTSTPALLSSVTPASEDEDSQLFQNYRGVWQEDDKFYLMTDSAACWFLREVESGLRPLRDLEDMTPSSFRTWLSSMRRQHAIRNDDVTITRIEIEKS